MSVIMIALFMLSSHNFLSRLFAPEEKIELERRQRPETATPRWQRPFAIEPKIISFIE